MGSVIEQTVQIQEFIVWSCTKNICQLLLYMYYLFVIPRKIYIYIFKNKFVLLAFSSKSSCMISPANFIIPAIQKTLVGRLQSVLGTSILTFSEISPQQVPIGACYTKIIKLSFKIKYQQWTAQINMSFSSIHIFLKYSFYSLL